MHCTHHRNITECDVPSLARGITTIRTNEGKQRVLRRIGVCGEYYQTVDGAWWTLNPQKGWVRVPETGRALQYALREANKPRG